VKRWALAAAAAASAAGVGVGILVGRATRTTSVSTRTVRAVTSRPQVQPAGTVPRTFSGAYGPHDVPLQALVPTRGRVRSAWFVPPAAGIPPEIVLTWDDDLGLHGLSVWQRARAPFADWRRIYLLRRDESLVEKLTATFGDATGDGHDDVLVFQDQDGSGGWGTYRLLAVVAGRMRQLYVRVASSDWTAIHLARGALVVRDGIGKDPRSAGDIHCCPRFIRTRVKRWNGRALVDVKVTTRPAPPPHEPR
jgi:hypothetical protein